MPSGERGPRLSESSLHNSNYIATSISFSKRDPFYTRLQPRKGLFAVPAALTHCHLVLPVDNPLLLNSRAQHAPAPNASVGIKTQQH